jgi:hypothetical protein
MTSPPNWPPSPTHLHLLPLIRTFSTLFTWASHICPENSAANPHFNSAPRSRKVPSSTTCLIRTSSQRTNGTIQTRFSFPIITKENLANIHKVSSLPTFNNDTTIETPIHTPYTAIFSRTNEVSFPTTMEYQTYKMSPCFCCSKTLRLYLSTCLLCWPVQLGSVNWPHLLLPTTPGGTVVLVFGSKILPQSAAELWSIPMAK